MIRTVFLVHGHDSEVRDSLNHFLSEDLGLKTVVMEVETIRGRALVEKFEDLAWQCDFAIVIMTADDAVVTQGEFTPAWRVRQNVLLEAGFFWGRLGRERLAFLVDRDPQPELPSDIGGLGWIPITKDLTETKAKLRKELRAAGFFEGGISTATAGIPEDLHSVAGEDAEVVGVFPAATHEWHNTGGPVDDVLAFEGVAWNVPSGSPLAGHAVFGPYVRLEKSGVYDAWFCFRATYSGASRDEEVLILDAKMDSVLHPRIVKSHELSARYRLYGVPFDYQEGRLLELRVERRKDCDLWVSYTAITAG